MTEPGISTLWTPWRPCTFLRPSASSFARVPRRLDKEEARPCHLTWHADTSSKIQFVSTISDLRTFLQQEHNKRTEETYVQLFQPHHHDRLREACVQTPVGVMSVVSAGRRHNFDHVQIAETRKSRTNDFIGETRYSLPPRLYLPGRGA